MKHLRLGLSQINCSVGDLEGNKRKIIEYIGKAKDCNVDIVSFPEMSIPGYPPEDLLLRPGFIDDNKKVLNEICSHVDGITAVIGYVDRDDDIYNAAAVIHNRRIAGVVYKNMLPNYSVFDENRYFRRGHKAYIFTIKGVRVGINICEDIWSPFGPLAVQVLGGGAELIVNINASPYFMDKVNYRRRMLAGKSQDNSVVISYTNMVGGQDELVFDGGSMVFNQHGDLISQAAQFDEAFLVTDVDVGDVFRTRISDPRGRNVILQNGQFEDIIENVFISGEEKQEAKKITGLSEFPFSDKDKKAETGKWYPYENKHRLTEEIYNALKLGLKDYFVKNGFSKAVIGLSGGIDSALCAVIAADALGNENVTCVFMPSGITSKESEEDARQLAENINVVMQNIPISSLLAEYKESWKDLFKGLPEDQTEENIQARIRGNLLMAMSNKFGWIVISTGNKSEMSVGYSTLYGDMAGGFALIKDIYKTRVYELAEYCNYKTGKNIIPERIITKAPTAELKEGQKDQDTLPPYDILDKILQCYIEEDFTASEIIEKGFDNELVKYIIRLVDKNEYKRRQAPIGIKVTKKAFGRDRRMPVSNRYLAR